MKTAIFVFPTLTGHLNRTLRLAKCLKSRDIQVIYAGNLSLEKFATQHGFGFHLLNSSPFAIGTENYTHKDKPENWLENIVDRFTNKEYNTRKTDLALMMKMLNPAYVFVDVFHFSDFVLLYPHLNPVRKFVFLLTKLPLQQDQNTPPLNTPFLPHEKNITWLWYKFFLKRALKRMIDFCKNLGKDNVSMLQTKFKEEKIPIQYKIFRDKVFQPSFENVAEWVLVPAEIDFPQRKLLAWQRCVGLMIDLHRTEKLEGDYKTLLEALPNYQKIIYCSLGTVLEIHQQRGKLNLKTFFDNLLAIFSQKKDYLLIISLEKSITNQLAIIPENVKIFENVPQIDLLKRCDLFITHGGMNSILESTTLGVPMLVFPLNQQWDQNGNAARVVFHGMGLMGNIKKPTKTKIEQQIETLLNAPKFKENVLKMSTELNTKYNDVAFLEKFLDTEL